ncbi:hypothetical protein LGQ02_18590 [Bacillus shivajii]|uniref:hypothetical protein n=1 Tax=Bacillus shivajii TaxID=1983719 RepID=UPI001CFB67CB|nr:hypothetical protein [Bacillus shivajii]UCZ52767.1 hypothetical protein LGQ02_18590 [Bacillus shivajii]
MREKIKSLVQQAVTDFLKSKENEERREVIVLLHYESMNPKAVIEHVKALSLEQNVTLIFSEQWNEFRESLNFASVVTAEGAKKRDFAALIEGADLLYVPTISHGLLAKVALTIDDDLPAWFTIQTQLAGKGIIFAQDELHEKRYRPFFAKSSVEKRVKSYVRQIQTEGVHLFSMDKVAQYIERVAVKQENIRPLVLAEHIEELSRNGETELVLPKKSIVTPMGKDAARELGITIKEAEEEKRDNG